MKKDMLIQVVDLPGIAMTRHRGAISQESSMVRLALVVSLLITVVSCVPSRSAAEDLAVSRNAETRLSILQGITTPKSTAVSVVAPRQRNLRVLLEDTESSRQHEPAERSTETFGESPWKVVKASFAGLRPNHRYQLTVGSEDGSIRDQRYLETFAEGGSKRIKFAVASCMDDSYEDIQGPMWRSLLAKDPDVIFMIGDNVYADRHHGSKAFEETPPRAIWQRYVQTRNTLAVFKAESLKPVLAVWDDHDFGVNNGGRSYEWKEESAEIFRTFFAQPAVAGHLEKGPGVSSAWQHAGQRFVFLDDRTFRTPNRETRQDQTHFGTAQEEWLFELLEQKAPTWLVSGDQFFGGYHRFESYEGNHPQSFRTFLERLRGTRSRVAFLSGDRHLTELMEIEPEATGYPTYELTSSGIHAVTFEDAWEGAPNERQIAGQSGVVNYAVVTSRVPEKGPSRRNVSLTAYGPEEEVLFSKQLRVPEAKKE